jgi:cytochrome P450
MISGRAESCDRALLTAAHPLGHPLLAALLGRAPARRVPGLGVLVADPVLVRRVLTDTSYRKDGPGSSGALWAGVLGHRTLIGMDGPPHRRMRRALTPLFTAEAAEQVCRRVLDAPLADLRHQLLDGRQVDLVAVARAGAGEVIAALVGMADPVGLTEAADQVLGMVTRSLSAAQNRRVAELFAPLAAAAGTAYDRAADRRQGDDVVGSGVDCVMQRLPALGLSREQAPALAAVLLLTGTETVVSALPRMVALLVDSGLLGELASRPHPDLNRVVDEAVRQITPSPAMLRRATRPDDLAGTAVRAGDRVLLATWWATRLPGGFDPARSCPKPVRQLAFGAGAHQCPGRDLATTQARLLLQAMLDVERVAPVRVVDRAAARRVFVPAYRRLVVAAGR